MPGPPRTADLQQPPVAIVGAGLLGLFTALELALSEAPPPLVVFDAGALGAGASWAAAGLLAPVHELEPTEVALTTAGFASQQLHYAWIERLGWSVGLRREGALELALMGADLPYVQRRYAQLQAHGLRVEWWGPELLRAREPALALTVPGGIFTPDDAQLDNRALVQALIATLQQLGVRMQPNAPVTAVTASDSGLELMVNGQAQPVQAVVLATGAAPPIPVPGMTLPTITPVRGQMLSLTPPAQGLIQRPLRLQSRTLGYGYLVPKADRIILGSTSEEMGHDPQLTAGGLLDILRRAYAAVPGIYDLPVRETWTGFRPATASRAPLVRLHPQLPIVWANGLYRHGVLLSPLLARAAVCSLMGWPLPEPIRALDPDAA